MHNGKYSDPITKPKYFLRDSVAVIGGHMLNSLNFISTTISNPFAVATPSHFGENTGFEILMFFEEIYSHFLNRFIIHQETMQNGYSFEPFGSL